MHVISYHVTSDHTISVECDIIDACHWRFHETLRWASEGDHRGISLIATDYIGAVRMNWFRFARAPALVRVDCEGAFKSHEFPEWCAARGIEVQVAAGEAQWQIGIVETHIQLLRNQLNLMEDDFPEASITDELVEHCVAAKVRRQTFDGYSPLQWWFGTERAREVEEHGLGQNSIKFSNDDWSIRQLHQQPLFVPTARKTLRVVQYARSRVLRNPTIGQLVRYFRRSKRGRIGGSRDRGFGGKVGSARVVAIEQATEVESQVAAVVW